MSTPRVQWRARAAAILLATAVLGSPPTDPPLAAPPTMPGHDALHVAARDGDTLEMELLLAAEANAGGDASQPGYFVPEWRSRGTMPPDDQTDIFPRAMRAGGQKAAALIRSMMVHEFDRSVRNGGTPLHHAAWNGHTAVVRQLLDHHQSTGWTALHGAVVATTADGKAALHFAALAGHQEIVELL